jgi:PBP1b-binding outer membrane lipoprotein LpoB
MKRIVLLVALALAGCSTAQIASTQTAITAATPVVATLVDLAAASNKTVASALADGAAICKESSGYVALAQTLAGSTAYASVTNAASDDVATACGIAGAVPAALPASVSPTSVPVVVLPVAAALKLTTPTS